MYQVTVYDTDGNDVVEFTCPMAAVEVIQDNRRAGYRVTYTNDPFAAVAALVELEG